MKRLKHIATCIVAGNLLAIPLYAVLIQLHAGVGWFYGVGMTLTGLTVFRIFSSMPGTDRPARRADRHHGPASPRRS